MYYNSKQIKYLGDFMIRVFSILFFLIFFADCKLVKALNMFELALIGSSVGLVYDQYFDDSLNQESLYSKKVNVVEKYLDSKHAQVNTGNFYFVPLQQQLSVIEEIHLYNTNFR